MSTKFELVVPSVVLKASFLDGLREFQQEGLRWHLEFDADAIASDFAAFVEKQKSKARLHTETLVPETELWGVVGGQYAGRISIRHELNEALRSLGGHIGYDVRRSMRGRGIASFMLGAALPVARDLGLREILLTCDDTNVPSIRVIEKHGGVLREKRSLDPAKPLKRYYWIAL